MGSAAARQSLGLAVVGGLVVSQLLTLYITPVIYLTHSRTLSGIELALGAVIVFGHNVWRFLPNEVPILVALALLSAWLRNGGLAVLGMRRPPSWWTVIGIAVAAAAARLLVGSFVVDPITARFWPAAIAPEGIDSIRGDWVTALEWLALVWTFAAIGEELSYRGYLLKRCAEWLGSSSGAHWIAVIVTAVLFGFGHYYKGPAGIIDSTVAGLILGAAYMLSGRILWTTMLAHGFIDSFAVVALYYGLDV